MTVTLQTASPIGGGGRPFSGTASGDGGFDPFNTTGSIGLGVAPGRGGQAQAMTVFPATYSMPTNVTKTAAKGALVSRHMLKVEPGEHMKTGQVGSLMLHVVSC